MARLNIQEAVNGLVSISIKLILVFSLFLLSSNHQQQYNDVSCAPQATQQHQQSHQSPLVANSREKTADLSVLINETLTINNKTISGSQLAYREEQNKPSFMNNSSSSTINNNNNVALKDDWTFDMVEYDLMEFLQDLSARYRLASKNNSDGATSTLPASDYVTNENLEAKSDGKIREPINPKTTSKQKDNKQGSQQASGHPQPASEHHHQQQQQEQIATTIVDKTNQTKQLTSSRPHEEEKTKIGTTSQEKQQQPPAILVTSEPPPISLASGDDHDIAESTWQYGIFDRFTRPRASQTSTTTASPPLEPLLSGSSNLDVKSFNSDECGLRTYEETEAAYFPSAGGAFELQLQEQQQAEASKELNQRRQRPPPGSSFFSSHKKYQSTGLGAMDDAISDGSDDQQLVRRPIVPPFDSFGESASSAHHQHVALGLNSLSPQSEQGEKHGEAMHSNSPGDGEFNLSFRRQWLQQQLGHTLQMLGFNTSTQSAADFLNQTSGLSLNFRENMMKKSNLNDITNNNKAAKSLDPAAAWPLPLQVSQDQKQQPEITEQELKARQDELKLEARVIGGSDARLGDSPWSVSLQALVSRPGTGGVEYRHYCGGTIISENYILTAAHCLDFMVGRESRLFVVVGDLNWRMSAASLHGRRFGIEKLIIHSGYKSTAFGHDIGLIKTKESMKPLKVNGRYIINSVCLPEKGVEHAGEAELVGWGLFSNRNEMADSLQIADVPILPRPLCVDLYKRRTGLIQWLIGIELITEKQICAGTFGRGICQGDSGSALVFNDKFTRVQTRPDGKAAFRKNSMARDQQTTRATIIGIVAFGGIRRCSYQSLPGVYMQTSKYLDWILPRIQN